MTKRSKEICIFQDFKNWNVRIMSEEEKTKSCRRSHLPAALNNTENISTTVIPIKYNERIRTLPIKEITKTDENVYRKAHATKKDENPPITTVKDPKTQQTQQEPEKITHKELPKINKIYEVKNGLEIDVNEEHVADNKAQEKSPVVQKAGNINEVANETDKIAETMQKNDDPLAETETGAAAEEGKD